MAGRKWSKINSISINGMEVRYRELPPHGDREITVYEFEDIEEIKSIGEPAFQKAMSKLEKEASREFGLDVSKMLGQVGKLVEAIEKRSKSFAKLHTATLDRGIKLKAHADRLGGDWPSAITDAEEMYQDRIGDMAKFFSMETHKNLKDALVFHVGRLFREHPYDSDAKSDSGAPRGMGDEYRAFRRRVFSLPPKKAVAALFRAQKSTRPATRGHFNYFISDLKDLYDERRYSHGAGIVLDEMFREGRISDEQAFRFNRHFLHRPLRYAAYVIPALHPIKFFILHSKVFFTNTSEYLSSPEDAEAFTKFIVTIYAIGQSYRYRISEERIVDKFRKKNKDFKFSALQEDMFDENKRKIDKNNRYRPTDDFNGRDT